MTNEKKDTERPDSIAERCKLAEQPKGILGILHPPTGGLAGGISRDDPNISWFGNRRFDSQGEVQEAKNIQELLKKALSIVEKDLERSDGHSLAVFHGKPTINPERDIPLFAPLNEKPRRLSRWEKIVNWLGRMRKAFFIIGLLTVSQARAEGIEFVECGVGYYPITTQLTQLESKMCDDLKFSDELNDTCHDSMIEEVDYVQELQDQVAVLTQAIKDYQKKLKNESFLKRALRKLKRE